jgi:hypothetical protein
MKHRCRLYRVGDGSSENSPGVFAEVWDTTNHPQEDDLPDGTLVFEASDESWEVTRERMDRYSNEHNIVLVGAWDARGSF